MNKKYNFGTEKRGHLRKIEIKTHIKLTKYKVMQKRWIIMFAFML